MNASWGPTSAPWAEAALETGVVWAGLLLESQYERLCAANAEVDEGGLLGQGVHLSAAPAMPVLKLEARRE